MFIQCLLESLLLLPFSFHFPSTSQDQPFLFPALPFLGEKLLFLACWYSFVPSSDYQQCRIGGLCFFVGQNWHFILPSQCYKPGKIKWNCKNGLEKVQATTICDQTCRSLLILSDPVPSWWKLVGGDWKRCDTGKEKSVGEMN